IAGMTSKAASGKGWIDHLHPEDRQRVCSEWYDAVQARAPFRSEYRFQRPDGSTMSVLGQAIPEKAPTGAIAGYVGTITDISERNEAEAERALLLDREQAARGEAERLLREQREASWRKDEFLAMLGHELRNPLSPIRNAVEILRMRATDPVAVARMTE